MARERRFYWSAHSPATITNCTTFLSKFTCFPFTKNFLASCSTQTQLFPTTDSLPLLPLLSPGGPHLPRNPFPTSCRVGTSSRSLFLPNNSLHPQEHKTPLKWTKSPPQANKNSASPPQWLSLMSGDSGESCVTVEAKP